MSASTESYKLKILLVGPAACGKTALIQRFIKSKFQQDYKLIVGVDILTKEVEYSPGKNVTLSIWDVGGQERFSYIRTTFYKGASGVILVFDLSRASTWDAIYGYYMEVRQFAGAIPFILIGNKAEMIEEVGEQINQEECRDFAEAYGSIYIATSARDGRNVDDAFHALANIIIKNHNNSSSTFAIPPLNPTPFIEKLRNGIPLSIREIEHPLFWTIARYIVDHLKDVDNPVAQEFITLVDTQLSVRTGKFRVLL